MNRKLEAIEVDVLVVGYGPVGASLAALLGKYGTKAMVIDKAKDIFDMPRAIALDNEALRILQLVGLSDKSFDQIAINEVRMHCPYVGKFGRANTAGTIDGHPKLVTFYQPELEMALRQLVDQNGEVQVELETELLHFEQHRDHVSATLMKAGGDEYIVKSRYLVGADGASSRIRQLIGQGFTGETYKEDWLVVDAKKNQQQAMNYVEFVCDPKRPTPHMPAPGGRERWEFMLQPDEQKSEMECPEKVTELLAPWDNASQITTERQAVYRFHARCCDCFQQDRVFLVGDAAHVTPPFVGQGLVAGLRDVANLAWKLSWVTTHRLNTKVMESYDLERRPHAKAMIDLAKFMGKLVMPRSVPKAILIHGMMRLIRFLPPARRYLDELKIKPDNSFKQGLFCKTKKTSKLKAGSHLPQELWRSPNGIEMSDEVLGDQFVVIGVGVDPRANLDNSIVEKWQSVGGGFIHLGTRGHEPDGSIPFVESLGNTIIDSVEQPWIIVVRPDRLIMAEGDAYKSKQLLDLVLDRLLN